MTHASSADSLRTLAALDPDTSVLELAIVGTILELAQAVDRLEAEHPPEPEGQRGFGTI